MDGTRPKQYKSRPSPTSSPQKSPQKSPSQLQKSPKSPSSNAAAAPLPGSPRRLHSSPKKAVLSPTKSPSGLQKSPGSSKKSPSGRHNSPSTLRKSSRSPRKSPSERKKSPGIPRAEPKSTESKETFPSASPTRSPSQAQGPLQSALSPTKPAAERQDQGLSPKKSVTFKQPESYESKKNIGSGSPCGAAAKEAEMSSKLSPKKPIPTKPPHLRDPILENHAFCSSQFVCHNLHTGEFGSLCPCRSTSNAEYQTCDAEVVGHGQKFNKERMRTHLRRKFRRVKPKTPTVNAEERANKAYEELRAFTMPEFCLFNAADEELDMLHLYQEELILKMKENYADVDVDLEKRLDKPVHVVPETVHKAKNFHLHRFIAKRLTDEAIFPTCKLKACVDYFIARVNKWSREFNEDFTGPLHSPAKPQAAPEPEQEPLYTNPKPKESVPKSPWRI